MRRRTEQRNSLTATADIAVHGVVPKIVARAGRRVRPLGVNEQLLVIRIFVEPCRRGQKARPLLRIARNLTCHSFCQLLVINHFPGHGGPPSLRELRVKAKKQLIKLLVCHLPELIHNRDGHGAQLLIFICQLRFHLAQGG